MSPPSHEQQPAFGAPSSRPEHEELPEEPGEGFVGEAENTRAVEQAASGSPVPVQIPSNPTAQVPVPSHLKSPPQDQSSQPPTLPQGWMPQIADDTDLIEKEWVDKAKEIVAHTAHDPYLQNKEINKVRAEYLKRRYNKDLKQSE